MRAVCGFINDNVPAILFCRPQMGSNITVLFNNNSILIPAQTILCFRQPTTIVHCPAEIWEHGITGMHRQPCCEPLFQKNLAQIWASPSEQWFLQQASGHPVTARGAWALPESASCGWPCRPLPVALPQNGAASPLSSLVVPSLSPLLALSLANLISWSEMELSSKCTVQQALIMIIGNYVIDDILPSAAILSLHCKGCNGGCHPSKQYRDSQIPCQWPFYTGR